LKGLTKELTNTDSENIGRLVDTKTHIYIYNGIITCSLCKTISKGDFTINKENNTTSCPNCKGLLECKVVID
jgi:hypothetical protein